MLLSLVPLGVLIASTGWQAYVAPGARLKSPGNFAFITLLSLFFASLLLAALNNIPPLSNVLSNRFLTQFLGKGTSFFIFAVVLKFVVVYYQPSQ